MTAYQVKFIGFRVGTCCWVKPRKFVLEKEVSCTHDIALFLAVLIFL